ncbi:MAG: hypothetical protein P1U57_02340 [Oleibacter sp.]|nr:hypothetical protein [Thalassolituus sp.]
MITGFLNQTLQQVTQSLTEHRRRSVLAQPKSILLQAVDYLQQRIEHEKISGNFGSVIGLNQVLEVIYALDSQVVSNQRISEQQAFEYMSNYTDDLIAIIAPNDAIEGSQMVADVLLVAGRVRQAERISGQLCSYAYVEELYGAMYARIR